MTFFVYVPLIESIAEIEDDGKVVEEKENHSEDIVTCRRVSRFIDRRAAAEVL